jgi:hypothetical protein
LPWTGNVSCRVVGTPAPELVAAAHLADAHHRGGETLAGRALTALFTLPMRGRKHRGSIRYDDVVSPALRTGTPETLTARIYRCDRTGPIS